MKNRWMALGLVLCVILMTFTGCQNSAKAEAAYRDNVTEAVTKINTANTEFSEAMRAFFQDLSEEKRTAAISAAGALQEGYRALGALEAPDKYQEIQADYTAGTGSIIQAIDLYKNEIQTVTEETFDETFAERLQAGDELLSSGHEKIVEATEKLQNLGE